MDEAEEFGESLRLAPAKHPRWQGLWVQRHRIPQAEMSRSHFGRQRLRIRADCIARRAATDDDDAALAERAVLKAHTVEVTGGGRRAYQGNRYGQ